MQHRVLLTLGNTRDRLRQDHIQLQNIAYHNRRVDVYNIWSSPTQCCHDKPNLHVETTDNLTEKQSDRKKVKTKFTKNLKAQNQK